MTQQAAVKAPRDGQFSAIFALLATGVGCAVVVLATPRAIVPTQLPPLALDSVAAARAIAADDVLSAHAPGGIDVDELEALYLEEGRQERAPPVEQYRVLARQDKLKQLAARVFARIGPEGVKALRAQAVDRFLRARAGQVADADEAAGRLGTFPQLLVANALTDAEGTLLAPELSLRASYKARFNLIHGLTLTRDFSAIERQAFEGWIALHAGAATNERRVQAARAFYLAGGRRSAQALSIWLHHGGNRAEAGVLMRRAYDQGHELFVRNYALGMGARAP